MSFSPEVGSSIGLVVVVFVVDVDLKCVFGRCGMENGCGCECGRMVCGRKRKGEILLESGGDV